MNVQIREIGALVVSVESMNVMAYCSIMSVVRTAKKSGNV